MAIMAAIAEHEDDIDGLGSDDEDDNNNNNNNNNVLESQCYPDIIQKVEELIQGHQVPSSYSRVALTSGVEYELIYDCMQLLLNIENGLYFMYRRQFPEAESPVQQPIIERISKAGNDSFGELLHLVSLRKRILDFVGTWMPYLAPNLSAIVGTTVAAKLMSTARGLGVLANMPPCNLQLLGFQRIFLDGLPTKLRLGYLQESEIFQTFPVALTTGVTLVLADKCSTAAQFDFMASDPSGNTGKHLKQVVISKFRRYSTTANSLLPQFGVRNQISQGTSRQIPEVEKGSNGSGIELSRTPMGLQNGDWVLKVVPWIGGRIISMKHIPSGTQWLYSGVDINGYEEYSGIEYRSAGCFEEYTVINHDLEQAGEVEALILEGNIGDGLILVRKISSAQNHPEVLCIDSSIVARNVGAGSQGYSRLVCLRVHPTFCLSHPTESYVSFVSIDGLEIEVWPTSSEQVYEGDHRPNGEWMLVDKCFGLSLVNKFKIDEVYMCRIQWGTGKVKLELWSDHRPVSEQSPLRICHEYEVRGVS